MDAHKELDVYIPKDAEVKNLPVKSLPNSLLRRLGLLPSDGDASRTSAGSSRVIWISPAFLRRKDQRPASCQGTGSSENTRSLLAAKFQAGSNPLQMSFVCSNRGAWAALKNISSGVSLSKTQALQDSAPLGNQNAVVIYQGQVYLCVKSRKSQGQPKAHELQKSSQYVLPSTPELPSVTSKQELARDGSQRMKRTTDDVNRSVKKNVALKRKAVGSECATPQSSDSESKENALFGKVLRPEPASEEAAQPPAYLQLQEEQMNTNSSTDDEMHDVGDENAISAAWNNDSDVQMDSQDSDRITGRTWTTRESVGLPAASSSLHKFDFTELENEERIAQLKAKLMEDDAALNNLSF